MRPLIAFLFLCGLAKAQLGANLVPPVTATDTAAQSGSWQANETWVDGTIPAAGEKVLIPSGVTVTNHSTTADVLWIHVAGVLTCCDHCDTQLNVHTLYVPMGGRLDLGSVGMPRTGKTVVEFTGGEPLPGDWQRLSGGLICHGEFTACGAEKTTWDAVAADVSAGATSLVLANVPFGWKVGDAILIGGTDFIAPPNPFDLKTHKYQSEQRVITAIGGRTVSWAEPLIYRHYRWRADLPFHCANLTRNVTFRSRKTDVPNRGHLMFMSAATDLRYVEVRDCGRTDKSKPVTDPRFDAYGEFVAGSDANPRARYAMHWHRVGELGPPATVRGCVVNGSPGWGFLNHRSNVQIDDCVAVRCFGFGFGTEEGQERGHFRRCLSALNIGQAQTRPDLDGDSNFGESPTGDWGKDGSGFWLQGGLVEVSDCVACDNSGRGFAIFNRPLNSYPDYGIGPDAVKSHLRFPIEVSASLLPAEYQSVQWWTQATPKPTAIPAGYVPQRVFARNTAYMNGPGFQSWQGAFNHNNTSYFLPRAERMQVTDLTLWGRGAMCHLEYTLQCDVDGLKVVGEGVVRPGSQGSQGPGLLIRGRDVTVKRYEVAGRAPLVDVGTDGEKTTHVVERVK